MHKTKFRLKVFIIAFVVLCVYSFAAIGLAVTTWREISEIRQEFYAISIWMATYFSILFIGRVVQLSMEVKQKDKKKIERVGWLSTVASIVWFSAGGALVSQAVLFK